jgi:hypothetical protein
MQHARRTQHAPQSVVPPSFCFSSGDFDMAIAMVKTDMPFTVFSMEADTDYLLARLVNFLGASFHSRAGLFSQQACEKYMKALSVQKDGTYAETHKLLELAAICEHYDAYFADPNTRRVLEQFDIFDQLGRYGGAAKFDPLARGKTVGGITFQTGPGVQVAGATMWTGGRIGELDAFVWKARSYLDFKGKGNGFSDSLDAIVKNDPRKSSHLAMWKFPVPLRDVLTFGNAYFKA